MKLRDGLSCAELRQQLGIGELLEVITLKQIAMVFNDIVVLTFNIALEFLNLYAVLLFIVKSNL